jgi:hypothetical protein
MLVAGKRGGLRCQLAVLCDSPATSRRGRSSSFVVNVDASAPAAVDDDRRTSHADTIATHLENAAAVRHNDVPTQQKEIEYAERVLGQWVEEY